MRKYSRFKLLKPSGFWESINIPNMFNAHEVAKHAQHSVVAMFVEKGYSAWGHTKSIHGPCWAVWNRKKNGWDGGFQDVEAIPHATLYDIGLE